MKKQFLTKCKKCGCDVFWLVEELGYKARVDEKTGILETYSCKHDEIKYITCNDCGEEYQQDEFVEINFCD